MRKIMLIAAVLLATGGCAQEEARRVADHKLEACKEIRDERLRVDCIKSVEFDLDR